jgi:hypothetical protein
MWKKGLKVLISRCMLSESVLPYSGPLPERSDTTEDEVINESSYH